MWFCTPPLALAPEHALAFSDPMHCKSARLDDKARACLHEGGGPQIGEVTPLGGVKK